MHACCHYVSCIRGKLFEVFFDPFRPLLLLIAAISFGLGISLPLIRFEKLYFFTETPSLIEVISSLWQENEIALAGLVFAFSILFPLCKLAATFQAVLRGRKPGGWAAGLAKWSMVDVLLVAILIFAAKTSGFANAFTQPGLWFFALSTISVAVASAGIK